MAILVTCEACKAKLRVRDEYQGKEVWCPACKAPLSLTGERVPNHEVFISYSNKDKAVADALCATLEAKSIRCWVAPRDIAAGNSWGGSIIEAIEDAQVMVLVYSRHSNLSPQIIREVERAVAKGLLIVPFRIEAAPMSKDMEYFLSASHWFDALTPPLEIHLGHFAEMVRLILFKKAKDATPGAAHAATVQPRANLGAWLGAAVGLMGVVLALGALLWVRQQQNKDVGSTPPANLSSTGPSQSATSSRKLVSAGEMAAATQTNEHASAAAQPQFVVPPPRAVETTTAISTPAPNSSATTAWIIPTVPKAGNNGWITLFDGEHLYGCDPTYAGFTQGKVFLRNGCLWADDSGCFFDWMARNTAYRIRVKKISGVNVALSIGPYNAWFEGGKSLGLHREYRDNSPPLLLAKGNSLSDLPDFFDMELTVNSGKITLMVNGSVVLTKEATPIEDFRRLNVWAFRGLSAFERIEAKVLDDSQTSVVVASQSSAQAGQPWTNSLGMIFVPVPGTAVQFSIWDTRVQDYRAFVTATARSWKKPDFEQGPTHPAVNVSWNDAKAFCAWLTGKERRAGTLNSTQEYRLPMDLEWSSAVGLGNETGRTPQARNGKILDAYPWGSEWPPPRGAGNYASSFNVDDFLYTSPVGSFATNRFGLYDLGGNVWQWCEDSFEGYSDGNLIHRGASYKTKPVKNKPDYRLFLSSYRSARIRIRDDRIDDIGFRCVLEGGGVPAIRTPSGVTSRSAGLNAEIPVKVQPPPPMPGYKLAWSDEFNGADLDATKWDYYFEGSRKGAINVKDAVTVADGFLTITTYTDGGRHFSGMISTRNKFEHSFGYYEARIKFEDSMGLSSGLWIESPSIGNPLGDPAAAGMEIDICDHRAEDKSGSRVANKMVHAVLWDGYNKDRKCRLHLTDDLGLAGGFHIYGLEWTEKAYHFFVDGKLTWAAPTPVSKRSEFLILSSEVEDGWAGSIPTSGYGSRETSQTKMVVDYVRYYERIGGGGTTSR